MVGMAPMRKAPANGAPEARASSTSPRASASTPCTCCRRAAPWPVSSTRPGARSNTVAPSQDSSLRICAERAGWDTPHRSAARPKWRHSATATRYSRSRRDRPARDRQELRLGRGHDMQRLSPRQDQSLSPIPLSPPPFAAAANPAAFRRGGCAMFLRIDRLQVEMPLPKEPDPVAAAAVQELMGGRFGEMTTLNTYMFQSFTLRQREKLRPFYALIANIATEELGHIELVGAAVNGLLNGMEPKGDMSKGDPSFAGMFSGAALKAHVAPGP